MHVLKRLIVFVLCPILIIAIASCGNNRLLDPQNPVTLTLWHNYGQQMGESMGSLIEDFNNTVGAERGIIVQITYIADTREINERLMMAVNKDPGAPPLPDIAVIYPRIGVTLVEAGLLMDLTTQFSSEEISAFVPSFIEEGKLGGDAIYIMPLAKSTEVLYLNATIFNRFAADTGVSRSSLATIEGILDAAEKYYEWSGGKAFFYPENPFHNAMVGMRQLGEEFVSDRELSFLSPLYRRMWDAYYTLAVKGGNAIFDNYGNYLMATGEIVCLTGSSASVTFYPDTVTFPDNTKESLELELLPYPVYEGGENVAIQRGGGMCVFRSDSAREYAAGIFLKWLTQPAQNNRFTLQTGYMPVTESAFREFITIDQGSITNENVRKLYGTLIEMQFNYSFFVPPVFEGFDEMQRSYNQRILRTAEDSRRVFLGRLDEMGIDAAFDEASQGAFESFISGR